MEELRNELVKAEIDGSSLGVCKGYSYTNKDGKVRYAVNEVYYVNGDKVFRKHTTDAGEFYYNVDLVDVVVETYITKDGNPGSKTYPLSETPYLVADQQVLENFLKFKLHR